MVNIREQFDVHPTQPNPTQQEDQAIIIMFEDVAMPFSCSPATVGVAALATYMGLLQLVRFRR